MDKKPTFVISCPFDTMSGYGARSRDIIKSIIETNKYNVKLLPQRWGETAWGFCKDHKEWEFLLDYKIEGQLTEKPDIWMQITIPNEFQPLGKYNIGCTAGIEATFCKAEWVMGLNKMDLNFVSSNFAKETFKRSKYQQKDKRTGQLTQNIELQKPIEVIFEGVDIERYLPKPSTKIDLSNVKESWCYLFVGHWMKGDFGHDRKNVSLLVKAFYETFKNKKDKPALILKSSIGSSSYMSRDEILKKIKKIRDSVNSQNLPNIYLFNGEVTDEEMNQLYNHPKVKAMVSLTKGEGFGRPLLEFSLINKPIITTNFSGHTDFLDPQFTTLLNGELEKIHKSAANDWLIGEAEWFKVDAGEVGKSLKSVYRNYKDYKIKAKKQGYQNRNKFNHQKMSELVKNILDKNIPDFPKQVDLVLPDLKLPKLKKVD